MNVTDIKSEIPTSGDRLKEIFAKQRLLMEKYEEIEEKNGLLQTKDIPVDLNDRFGQARLKDFAWRTVEELAEAAEAVQIHPELVEHQREEVIDALHFLTELTILAGVSPEELSGRLLAEGRGEYPPSDPLGEIFYLVEPTVVIDDDVIYRTMSEMIVSLGCTMNTCRNKAWKNTHMLCDTNLFKKHLVSTWYHFFRLCIAYGMTPEMVDDLYFRKNQVNQFRQRSNY